MWMNKFYQIISELWPLIDVQYCVLLNIILTNGQILMLFFCFVTKYPVVGYVACLQRFYCMCKNKCADQLHSN